MMGRGWIGIAFVVPMFAGCIELGGALSAPAPVWESGYTFSYVDTMTYDVFVSAQGEREDETGTEGPFHYSVEVLNTTLGDDEPVYIVAYSGAPLTKEVGDFVGSFDGAMLLALRQRDLAPIGALVTGCAGDAADCRAGRLETFGIPDQYTYLDFPLTTGKEWGGLLADGSGDPEVALDGPVGVRYDAIVKGTETVETPIGRIQTKEVRFTYGLVGVDELRDQMEKAMREAGGRVKRFNIDYEVRETVFWSPEYEAAAKTVVDAKIVIEMVFEMEDSEDLDVKVDIDLHGDSLLEGARLLAKPERDVAQMAAIASGSVPMGDAKGAAIRPAGYTLALTTSASDVNVVDEEPVRFEGKVVGVPLPEDHEPSWRIEDFVGRDVATGPGLAFEHVFDEPGQYRAILMAKDGNGTLTAADVAFVFAEYHAKVSAACPVVSLEPVSPACDAVLLPVRPGIRSLTVSASRSGASANPVSPEMRLRDSARNEERSSGNFATMDDFTGFRVDGKDWEAEYYHAGLALSDVEYQVDLEYAPDSPATPAKVAAATGLMGGFASTPALLELVNAGSAADAVRLVEARLSA